MSDTPSPRSLRSAQLGLLIVLQVIGLFAVLSLLGPDLSSFNDDPQRQPAGTVDHEGVTRSPEDPADLLSHLGR
ncbi:hypothetical protein [Nocardioides sp. SYSU D00038]|uniref:hypothetical protein n=1 Tax=Nocardioides sp. SYSU D00038 TaxID=2812554 RepID=UPI001966E406|nr:hypothetical protein [Nocardioides sp. SYSU D00038]